MSELSAGPGAGAAPREGRLGVDWSSLLQDVRGAARMFSRRPMLTVVLVVILSVGIAMNAAAFNLVSSMLLRPLPYAAADRLVALHESQPMRNAFWSETSIPNFLDWREQSTSFQGMAAFVRRSVSLSAGDETEWASGCAVTTDLFEVLGVRPALGRTFVPEEGRPGAARVVLLGDGMWRRRFGSAATAIGATVQVNGLEHVIVGVMPGGFAFPEQAELWIPLQVQVGASRRDERVLDVFARLRPGVSPEAAAAEMALVGKRLEAQLPETNFGWSVQVNPLRRELMPDGPRIGLYLMMAAVACLLLIVLANVSAMMLAFAAGRTQEIATRLALGAGRARLFRQMFTETALISAGAAAIAIPLSVWAVRLLVGAVDVQVPFWIDFSLDWRVLAFSAAVAGVAALAVGYVPAIWALRVGPAAAMKAAGRSVEASGGKARFLKALVVGEAALSLVLLATALLIVQSYRGLQRVPAGFTAGGLLTMRASLGSIERGDGAARARVVARIVAQLQAVPGVTGAVATDALPVSPEGYATASVIVPGVEYGRGAEPKATQHAVTRGYFGVMGIPLLEGRDFTDAEVAASVPAAIISDTLAARLFSREPAVGRTVRIGGPGAAGELPIVGVVGTARPSYVTAGVDPWPDAQIYVPPRFSPASSVALAIRTDRDPLSLAGAARNAVREVDPRVPVHRLATMEEVMARALWLPRLWTWVFATFGAVALAIATLGVYGVTSYTTALRRREMAIRRALGATPAQVVGLVARRSAALASLGLALGLPLAAMAAVQLEGFMSQLGGSWPAAVAAVAGVVFASVECASAVAGASVARAEVSAVLREE